MSDESGPSRARSILWGATSCLTAALALAAAPRLFEASDRVAAQSVPDALDAGASGPVCNNGVVEPGEDCEPRQITLDDSCPEIDPSFTSGLVYCDQRTCRYDTSRCRTDGVSLCGDGIVTGAEQCEDRYGTTPLAATCASSGLGEPDDQTPLRCNPATCTFNPQSCRGQPERTCGDGRAEQFEQCDGDDLRGLECANVRGRQPYLFRGGVLRCTDACLLDTSGCIGTSGEICGNGVVDPGEECDGDARGKSCADINRRFGQARCSADCKLDYSQCRGGCNWTRLGIRCN